MAINDVTATLGIPKPHQDNTLLVDVGRLRSALDAIDTHVAGKQAALGFTPENVANKGAVGGYAPLDGAGHVPAAHLPSFVDDVLEYVNLAGFPVTGETGKIYVALDTNKVYRWSGTVYVEISASPGSTDAVVEGSVNLYFTALRARAAQLPATPSTVGVVKIGNGLSVDAEGLVSLSGAAVSFSDVMLTATVNGQTAFTVAGGYTAGMIDLFLNGARLEGGGDDYTATDGLTITLTVGLQSGEHMVLRRWSAFQVADTLAKSANLGDIEDKPAARAALGVNQSGMFYKTDASTPAFTKLTAGTAQVKAGTIVEVGGTLVTFATATAITMPALTAGTDYAIWVKTDGTIQADASFTVAPGAGTWRKIGGFHYAPGGNATGTAGGDTTPAINEYSLWDLKFRPACPDPRGMALVAGGFWGDIYLTGVDHLTNGTSKYNVSIADGSAPPKKPLMFGGNGTTTQTNGNWWNMVEVLQSHGKRPPTYDEFAAMAYGTTEATSSGGTDVPTTGVTGTGATSAWNLFTSKWGVVQAAGCMYVWGAEFGGPYGTAAWTANTGGRGSTYNLSNAVVFGGPWSNVALSGSRAAHWIVSPTFSDSNIAVRGVANHLQLD